jgi:hypothetical protein
MIKLIKLIAGTCTIIIIWSELSWPYPELQILYTFPSNS